MSAGDGPPRERPSSDNPDDENLLTRFRTAETGPLMFVRELLTSMATVAAVGLLLFAISGVWPPMVAVESGSMNPHMQKGDLIFVSEPGRYMPDYDHAETGVVTYRVGQEQDYRTFDSYGSVVVYKDPESFGPPIIHRARFWVDEGENWYDEADKSHINAESCSELLNCPAPHAGFITKGDNNPYYDQANGISPPVKAEWLVGTARLRIPYLGWIRLGFSGAAAANPIVPGVATTAGGIPDTALASGAVVSGAEPAVSGATENPARSRGPASTLVSVSGDVAAPAGSIGVDGPSVDGPTVDGAQTIDTPHLADERRGARLAASSGTPVAI